MLLACCKAAKIKIPEARRIVGIATEPLGTSSRSEDLLLLETVGDSWTTAHEKEARELQKELGLLKDGSLRYCESHDEEYPDSSSIPSKRVLDRAERRRLDRQQRRSTRYIRNR
jgi:hypothetical protein